MESLSSVGLGLSVVFGFLFLALVTEIYYLLWWKRSLTGRAIEGDKDGNPTRDLFYIFCCYNSKKNPFSQRPSTLPTQELKITVDNQSENGLHYQTNKDLYLFDENCLEEPDFMLGPPPRFLFTIKEETKEDLESEDGKSKVGRKKLSDLMQNGDTPYMTPLSSPAFFTTPHKIGYNPLYESSSDLEFIKMKSSPPPKFKFLRDAEEKLRRKNILEEDKRDIDLSSSSITINTTNSGLHKGEEDINQYHSP